MSKKENKDIEVIEVEEEKTEKKKKMPKYKKRQLMMKISAWAMALIMIAGVVMSFLMYFIY